MTAPNTPRGEKSAQLTWGASVGGLGAMPASPGPAPRQTLGREERAHSPRGTHRPPPCPAALASAPQTRLPGEGCRGARAPRRPAAPPPQNSTPTASSTPSSGHAQSHPQDGGRGPADTRRTRGRCRSYPHARNHCLPEFPDFAISAPPKVWAGSPRPRLRLSPLQFCSADGRPCAASAAPGLDNGRSAGAEPEVRLRTRSLAPATQGSGERADYTSQRPPRAAPRRQLGSKPRISPGAAAGLSCEGPEELGLNTVMTSISSNKSQRCSCAWACW